MAIKSTRNLSLTILKLVIIALSCALFVQVYFAGQQLLSYYLQNNDGVLSTFETTDNVLANGRSTFAQLIRTETGHVRTMASKFRSDEYVESGEGIAELEKNLRNRFDENLEAIIIQEKINLIEAWHEYDYSNDLYTYPGIEGASGFVIDFSSDEQIQADRRSIQLGDYEISGLTTRNGKQYYKGFPLDKVTLDNLEQIKKSNEQQYNQELAFEKSSYTADYVELKRELSELKSYRYFLVNKTTGAFYTNIAGAETIDDAAASFEDGKNYRASIINGEFTVSETLNKVLTGDRFYSYGYVDGNSVVYREDNAAYQYCFGTLDPTKYDMYVYVDLEPDNGDVFSKAYKDWSELASSIDTLAKTFVICFISWVLTIIALVILAGNKNPDGTVAETPLDRMPNSIHFIVSWAFTAALASVPMIVYLETLGWKFKPSLLIAAISVFANLTFIEWMMSVSRQVKNRHFWKNTIIYKLLIKNFSRIRRWANSGINKITHSEIKKKVYLVFAVYVAAMVALWVFSGDEDLIGVGFALSLVISAAMFFYARKLSKGLDAIASALTKAENGDYDFSVDIAVMPEALKPMGENVNNLTKGLNLAVADATKSERMKTELITNVSHDLKTPLTSIITYTDLLKQCRIEDEKAREYIAVLDEKSHRLKTLVEDLVEASKASSGNVVLNMVEINVNELCEQIYGEYEDDLKDAGLDLKLNAPKEPIFIVADGQKTYRIIENLFSNVKKYAMPGSRVYLDITSGTSFANITMKNVAKDEMHFDVDRLTERFVQGEESRTNEGSGLGLSIAKSLTELQGGRFVISVDGDLFKVSIALPIKKQ